VDPVFSRLSLRAVVPNVFHNSDATPRQYTDRQQSDSEKWYALLMDGTTYEGTGTAKAQVQQFPSNNFKRLMMSISAETFSAEPFGETFKGNNF
jgi:hypothetical protein